MKPSLRVAEDTDIMTFGKYKGQKLFDIPDSYIVWMWETTTIKQDLAQDTKKGEIVRYFEIAYRIITT